MMVCSLERVALREKTGDRAGGRRSEISEVLFLLFDKDRAKGVVRLRRFGLKRRFMDAVIEDMKLVGWERRGCRGEGWVEAGDLLWQLL